MIHEKIKQLRLQNNFTQEEMAASIFCSQNTYSLIESGKTILVDVERIVNLEKKLKVSPERLLEGIFEHKLTSKQRQLR